ncbi:unnamed protein product [Dovyalis caffra]|uniref:Cytochrome P450 n=1 Tax=Dovyalis caffra TaxID=77055 RepID=A0AAV1RL86_9ROSI|nr:unnamed protein product [Dovyalis caffra]
MIVYSLIDISPKWLHTKLSNVLDRIATISDPKLTRGWKSVRALCRNELFSLKAIESQAVLRKKKVGEIVEFLGTKEGKACWDFVEFEDDGAASRLKSLVRRMAELGATPNLADFYPIFADWILKRLKRNSQKVLKKCLRYGEFTSRKEEIATSMMHRFLGCTETTATAIEWVITELLKSKEVMKKVREELKREITNSFFKEYHVSQLPYLNACREETPRLHHPEPFLVPNSALETCEVMNYTIPRDSQVTVNIWAIDRARSFNLGRSIIIQT